MKATQICTVDGCERAGQMRRGMCEIHYRRLSRQGGIDSRPSPAERLAAGLVRMPNGCLEWTGHKVPKGYGQIGYDSKVVSTHRLAWELVNGPIPDGLNVLHHCDNPPCCETQPTEGYPDGHLFLGTKADNNADMRAKGRARGNTTRKTHCPANHHYDEANTYIDKNGYQHCRTCHRDAVNASNHQRSAEVTS
jgi:hypothetical protein